MAHVRSLCLVGIVAVAAGCGPIISLPTPDPVAVGPTPPPQTDGADSGAPVAHAPLALGFHPSNLPDLSGVTISSDLVFSASCPSYTLDTDAGSITCAGDGSTLSPVFLPVAQTTPNPDGSPAKAAVFAARDIIIEPSAEVHVQGKTPLVLVAASRVSIGGRLIVRASNKQGVAGGFSPPTDSLLRGNGPGGGAPGLVTSGDPFGTATAGGATGGSYCGLGGAGGGASGPAPAAYGAPTLIPLIGGSSGGNGKIYFDGVGGAGGGAVQLVAGALVEVLAQGHVNAGGGGAGDTQCANNGHGGGSGGAILVEAPTVTIAGALAANGGAGGGVCASTAPVDATEDASRAVTSPSTFGSGGSGSGGPTRDGAPGTVGTSGDGNSAGGGGGGGAGRLRINTKTGAAALDGAVLSPDPMTACATFGTIAP